MEKVVDTKISDSSWVFDLEDDGTVLHSSFRSRNLSADSLIPRTIGRNFFDQDGVFEDISAFYRQFKNFVRGRKAAERLTVKCVSGNRKFDAKISMTRTIQTGYYTSAGVIMLEITN